MQKRISIITSCALLLLSFVSGAKTFQTISSGNWNDSLSWYANEIPPWMTTDTIIISDSLVFDHHLYLAGHAQLKIENGGGLCGHETITITSGTACFNAGMLELDTLIVDGGYFLNYGAANLLFKNFMHIYNGGSSASIDSSHTCGCYWDECFAAVNHSNDTVISNDQIEFNCLAKIYPSPGDGAMNLEYSLFSTAWFSMYNTAGQLVSKSELPGLAGVQAVHAEALAAGLYIWEVRSGENSCGHGKIVVTK
jgi:hypothetical protein